MSTRIDAHQHYWRPARGDYGWLRPDDPALWALYRDFLPAQLLPQLKAAGVAATVLMQAAATEAETDFLLALAADEPSIAGVVGWVDLARPEAAATLQRWARPGSRLCGVRPMLQDLPEVAWIATAPHPQAVQALIDLGLRFDALVKPPHLAPLLQFIERWPALPVVIDHAAKPALAQGWNAGWAVPWRRGLEAAARHPQVMCKFSGLLTEMSAEQRRTPHAALEVIRPVWHTLLEHFGPQRLVWGSDWPVLTLAGDHAGWVALTERLLEELSAQDRAAVLGGNALRFYGLHVDAAGHAEGQGGSPATAQAASTAGAAGHGPKGAP